MTCGAWLETLGLVVERVYVAYVELSGEEPAIGAFGSVEALFEWIHEYFPSDEYTDHIIQLAHETGREVFERSYMIAAAPDYAVADDAFDEPPWAAVESVTVAIVPLFV